MLADAIRLLFPTNIRPSSNKKSFPVHRPGGFFFLLFFFTFPPVHSSLKKIEIRKKKKSQPPDWQFFSPPGPQETIFYLRVALYGVQAGFETGIIIMTDC